MKKGMLKYILEHSDIILEVLDSRIPLETRNKKIERLLEKNNKTLILVLNKSDLVPEYFAEKVKDIFEQEYPTVFVSTKTRKGLRALRKCIKIYSPEKEKVKIGVIGYPNTGKSSLINSLVGRRVTTTGSFPGITKGIQLVKLSKRFYLIDTPGIIPIKDFEKAVIIGAIDPSKIKYPEKACYILLKKFLEKRGSFLLYNIEIDNPKDFLKKMAEKYKKPIREISIKILRDWILGKIKVYWI